MKTKSVKWGIMAMALLSMAMPFTAKAQDKVEASAGVDLVSGYVWRGQDLGGVRPPAERIHRLQRFLSGSLGLRRHREFGHERVRPHTGIFNRRLQRIGDGLLVQCDRRWGDSQILPVRCTQCCQLTSVRSANRL